MRQAKNARGISIKKKISSAVKSGYDSSHGGGNTNQIEGNIADLYAFLLAQLN